MDEVTPFQAAFAVAEISERFLLPVLAPLIDTCPFAIRGFHSDNGSEYSNGPVARLLEKLRIEHTQSRVRQTPRCALPTEAVDAKGKRRKHYRYQDMMTPYDQLKSLAEAAQYLKPGITFQALDAIATPCSDNDAALRLNQARAELFQRINRSQNNAA